MWIKLYCIVLEKLLGGWDSTSNPRNHSSLFFLLSDPVTKEKRKREGNGGEEEGGEIYSDNGGGVGSGSARLGSGDDDRA